MQLSNNFEERFWKFCTWNFFSHKTCNDRYISEFLKGLSQSRKWRKNKHFLCLLQKHFSGLYAIFLHAFFCCWLSSSFGVFKKWGFMFRTCTDKAHAHHLYTPYDRKNPSPLHITLPKIIRKNSASKNYQKLEFFFFEKTTRNQLHIKKWAKTAR